MNAAEGSLGQLDPGCEQCLPGGGGRHERRPADSVGVLEEGRRLFELAKTLLRATRVGGELTEEGAELLREEQGQDSAEASLVWASIAGDPVLQRLLLALIKGQETLCTTLGRLAQWGVTWYMARRARTPAYSLPNALRRPNAI